MTEASVNHQRYLDIRTVTVVGGLVNVVLSVVKVVVGVTAHSHALIADGIHSMSDLASDAMVIYAARHGSRDADEHHPYGHARIETAFTVALGVLLVAVAVGIIMDAGRRLLDPALLLQPEFLALAVAVASILSKEWLYHYTKRVARRLRSPMLHANAWHHRSDAISSVVVLVGVAGSMAGLNYLDPFASAAVALMIAKIGWDLSWNALRELVDTGLEPERVAKIRESILLVEGVRDLHMLRTRRMGGDALVDVHVQVDPRLSVSEGHQIGEYVRSTLVEEIDEVADVTVHIDSEDERSGALCRGLPLRREILSRLYERWRAVIDPALIQRVNLHYLSGKIHVELVLPLTLLTDVQQARALTLRIRQAAEDMVDVGPIYVYFV